MAGLINLPNVISKPSSSPQITDKMATSDNYPNTLQELQDHLNGILSNPAETQLNVKLVETFTAQLTGS
jgi:hypothetical protein